MVCDPLHRMFVRVPLPPIPDHLIAGKHCRPGLGWFPFLVPLLVPLPASEKEKEPPLQVVWMLQRGNAIIAFVFTTGIRRFGHSAKGLPSVNTRQMTLGEF